ncbi:hypothetical protein HYPSUDRAFT_41919 [Hypholoma sublateritium FD-334 SS-4]|uniref:Uncharacterized protein n=1 Tax=Hypholoma sublateritium (strain FD-334 SS-4) TaxID=945553 RepID=A0A0D2MDE0_HYPSF|nr:hypothetical protein HYPSUDRAFT_41919 [Hypholoma sublateritium FD-334 SS-4]
MLGTAFRGSALRELVDPPESAVVEGKSGGRVKKPRLVNVSFVRDLDRETANVWILCRGKAGWRGRQTDALGPLLEGNTGSNQRRTKERAEKPCMSSNNTLQDVSKRGGNNDAWPDRRKFVVPQAFLPSMPFFNFKVIVPLQCIAERRVRTDMCYEYRQELVCPVTPAHHLAPRRRRGRILTSTLS